MYLSKIHTGAKRTSTMLLLETIRQLKIIKKQIIKKDVILIKQTFFANSEIESCERKKNSCLICNTISNAFERHHREYRRKTICLL